MNKIFIALLLFSAMSISCNEQKQEDVVIYENVDGYSISDSTIISFESIAFQDGKVLGTSDEGLLKNEYPSAEVIDGQGNVMLPGLIDAHAHVMNLGFNESEVNLSDTRSREEAVEKVKKYAEENPDLPWVRGRGWNHTRWNDIEDFPSAEDLDEAVDDRPVWLTRVDGHAGWANTEAMKQAGISRDTPEVDGGSIQRDGNGNATGIFVDHAMNLIENELPERTDDERETALELALSEMKKHGITSVHDAGVDVETWNLYKQFAEKEQLTIRIYGMISGAGEIFDKLAEDGPVDSLANDLLALCSVKLYADGALGSRGAAMMEPYSDESDNTGLLFEDEKEMAELIHKAASEGFQVNVHAIGDQANRMVLNAHENVRRQLDETQDFRHRIEHAQVVNEDDIPQFKELDIVASMQPTHATSDMNMAEDRVGTQRIGGAYAWRSFLDQGPIVAAGSDFPVEDVNPFYGLYSAVTRQDQEGEPPNGWYSEQALNREEALRAFTIDAAWAAHQEEKLGSLEAGKWADFILIDRNYFEVPDEEIWQIKVVETWLAGEKVYDAEEG